MRNFIYSLMVIGILSGSSLSAYSLDDAVGHVTDATETVAGVSSVKAATVMVAKRAGAISSTGTAIAKLRGAAATRSTMAMIGRPLVAIVRIATGVVIAPSIAGGVTMLVVSSGVVYGMNTMFGWVFGD